MGVKYDIGMCVDCGERRKVWHREWLKATQPRCLGCGGRLEPSVMASNEHTAHRDKSRAVARRHNGVNYL